MLGHKISFNKFKKIEITKYLFLPQWYKTRNQLQDENWKIHKSVESKQHAHEPPMDQRRNQKINQKISWNKRKCKHNIPKP